MRTRIFFYLSFPFLFFLSFFFPLCFRGLGDSASCGPFSLPPQAQRGLGHLLSFVFIILIVPHSPSFYSLTLTCVHFTHSILLTLTRVHFIQSYSHSCPYYSLSFVSILLTQSHSCPTNLFSLLFVSSLLTLTLVRVPLTHFHPCPSYSFTLIRVLLFFVL